MKQTHTNMTIQPLIISPVHFILRLGDTAFGGPAMGAYIRKMAVEKNHWLDIILFVTEVALCQDNPPEATAMKCPHTLASEQEE